MNDDEYYEVCLIEVQDFYRRKPTKKEYLQHYNATVEHASESLRFAKRAIRLINERMEAD